MKIVITAATAAMALGLAAPAFAQDVPVERAPFTGARAEAILGYDRVADGEDNSNGKDGLLYGGAIGYDAQVGGVVLGVEGEITGSTVKTRNSNLLTAGDNIRVKAGRDLYAGARLGFVISPDTMIYAKGGYTNARFNTDYSVGTARLEQGDNLDGFRVGAGIERMLGANTYVKGEYRYSHYGELDGYDIDLDRHQVLAGVGVRF
jgi:outer membrane immunogenic protein